MTGKYFDRILIRANTLQKKGVYKNTRMQHGLADARATWPIMHVFIVRPYGNITNFSPNTTKKIRNSILIAFA